MARLIDAESPQNSIFVSDYVIEQMKKIPTVDAVPIPELDKLRDRLDEGCLITRRGLRDLNMLIAKYEGGKTDAPD